MKVYPGFPHQIYDEGMLGRWISALPDRRASIVQILGTGEIGLTRAPLPRNWIFYP